ncbi:uncharacterized protein BDV14DRAFT_42614 [Aspergillus stella-maris]|uniref:uncharacterized protein n=1 Tax=Aspergillus stella-maris TaxID=1810926 RepID=UPI003CCCBAA1
MPCVTHHSPGRSPFLIRDRSSLWQSIMSMTGHDSPPRVHVARYMQTYGFDDSPVAQHSLGRMSNPRSIANTSTVDYQKRYLEARYYSNFWMELTWLLKPCRNYRRKLVQQTRYSYTTPHGHHISSRALFYASLPRLPSTVSVQLYGAAALP